MAGKYNHIKIEKKWQKIWESKKIYKTQYPSSKKKYYALIEFPYPSGDGLHVGHVRSYTAMDIVARKRRMEGYNVMYPIGWDAFGLPTENYAIKTKTHPKIVTKKNSDNFRRQLKLLGFSFDWEREINTSDPEYYKWTQWIFLKFFEKGLAYKAKTTINWCKNCKIGLANEEVVGGQCERCGGEVEKRDKEQWMLKITAYAEKLLEGLKRVDYIPEAQIQQENWIGKSEGAEIDFKIKNFESAVRVFTTRPDTLFGATFLVLGPEHPGLAEGRWYIANGAEVEDYIKKAKAKTDEERMAAAKEKTGVLLKGVVAINPATQEEVPVWVADYVLGHVGTGAIMGVPAHDQRDYEFAKKYNLPIKVVVEPVTGEARPNEEFRKSIVAIIENPKTNKIIAINWGEKLGGTLYIGGGVEGSESLETVARREIEEETGYKNLELIAFTEKIHHHYIAASKKVNRKIDAVGFYFKLLDEAKATRKLAKDEKGKFSVEWISKSEAAAKVKDPLHAYVFGRLVREEIYTGRGVLVNSGKFTGVDSEKAKGEIIEFVGGKKKMQYRLRDWVFSRQRYWGEPIPLVHCEKCAKWVPVPEKSLPVTLPNVKNYTPTDTGESPLAAMASWVITKCPRCGGKARRETDVMPNWAGSSWYFLRYTDPKNKKAFADAKKMKHFMPVDWYNGGMEHTVLHLLYSRFWNQFLYYLKLVPTREPYKKRTSHGLILGEGGMKMSKSKGNVVNPDTVASQFGADALRMYEMFLGPFNQSIAWDSRGIVGVRRFLERVWQLRYGAGNVERGTTKQNQELRKHYKELERLLHQTIKKVSEDIEEMRFNTAVSALMVLLNKMEQAGGVTLIHYTLFLKLLSPFAPHIADELWAQLGNKKSIHLEKWPKFNPKLVKEDTFMLVIQINGKVRDSVEAEFGIAQQEAEHLVFARARIQELAPKNKIKKVVFVPNRLINIVM